MKPVLSVVTPVLVTGIHVFLAGLSEQDVDGRVKPGHDEKVLIPARLAFLSAIRPLAHSSFTIPH